VLTLAPSGGSAAYLGWLLESTASKPMRTKASPTRKRGKTGKTAKSGKTG
jgi:hypothetical protein